MPCLLLRLLQVLLLPALPQLLPRVLLHLRQQQQGVHTVARLQGLLARQAQGKLGFLLLQQGQQQQQQPRKQSQTTRQQERQQQPRQTLSRHPQVPQQA
jgi:hypothetical protein